MLLENHKMQQRIDQLAKHLCRSDLIGYAAARNTRYLKDAAQDYISMYESLVQKYGREIQQEDGSIGFQLNFDTPEFKQFVDELTPYATIEHETKIFKIPYEEAINRISGEELLEIDWMFEDIEKPVDITEEK